MALHYSLFEHTFTRLSQGFLFSTQTWHFWHFCTKLTLMILKSFSKNKVASSRNWVHNTSHQWIRRPMPIPLCHPDMCWIEDPEIELCFMFHFTFRLGLFLNSVQRYRQGMTNWQCWISIKLLIQWCCEFNSHCGREATLFFAETFQKPLNVQKCQKCQICVENENRIISRICLHSFKTRTRSPSFWLNPIIRFRSFLCCLLINFLSRVGHPGSSTPWCSC